MHLKHRKEVYVVSILAQVIGVVLGASAGYFVGGMIIAGYGSETIDLTYVFAGIGALVGFMIGRAIARKYEDEIDKSNNA